MPCLTTAGKGLYFSKGHRIRVHSFGLEAGRTALLPSHHGSSRSRAGSGALTLDACPSAASLHLAPTRARRAPSSSNSFAQKEAVSEPFSIALPQAILSAPSPNSSAAAPTPAASALHFRRRPSFRCSPRPGPRPQGRLAPQATPLSPWLAGRAGGEAPREGRGRLGACPPPSWAAIGWAAETGRDCCLCLGAPGSSPGILRSSTSGSGDSDARVATLVRAACLTSGQQWTPKLGGFPIPSRVSPVPLARPVGSPAVPFISFREEPQPKAPGISPRFHSRVTVAHNRRLCPLYAENDEPYFPGWGESFRDVRVQNARPVPRTAGTRQRGRVSGAHSQSRDSRYPAAARCQALCQRFPLVISWRARVTGGSGWWNRGPNLPATPGARGKLASSPPSVPAPSEDSSATPLSPTLRVSPGPPELERTPPAPHPGQFVLLNPGTDRCGFATGSLHSCGRRLFLASFLYLFPASLSASLWPLHFLCSRNIGILAFGPP